MTRRRQPNIRYQDPGVEPLGRDVRTGTRLERGQRVPILDTVVVAKVTRQLRRASARAHEKALKQLRGRREGRGPS